MNKCSFSKFNKLLFTLLLVFFSAVCIACEKKDDSIVVISEDTFLKQLNQIFLNKEKYIGREIEITGSFLKEEINDELLTGVFRETPGDCGNDGIAGFDLDCKKFAKEDLPNNDTWVRVVGTLSTNIRDDKEYLIIKVNELEVESNIGKTFVTE